MNLVEAAEYVAGRLMSVAGSEIPTETNLKLIVNEAVKRLSERYPKYTDDGGNSTVVDQKFYDKPTDCIRVIHCQNVTETTSPDEPLYVGFQDYGEQIALKETPATIWTLKLWYAAYWPAIAVAVDTTIPVRLHEALLDKAASLALQRMASRAAMEAEITNVGDERQDLTKKSTALKVAAKDFEQKFLDATKAKGLWFSQGRTANDRSGDWP